MHTHERYDEDYDTCSYTHAWLRVIGENMSSDEVTDILGVTPTEVQQAGTPRSSQLEKVHKVSGWFLSTEGLLKSRDARLHLDWILERVNGRAKEFEILRGRGYLIDVCCRWDSKSAHGGPTLSPRQMGGFFDLGIELWFDIYFDEIEP